MNIVILGKGNMGKPISALAQKAGHNVQCFGSEGAPIDALGKADIVVIAVKYPQALEVAGDPAVARALSGKLVIDVTNPLADDFMSLTVGHTSSAAEEIAGRLPGARVVKAFNTVFAAVIAMRAEGREVSVPVFVAGDDEDAVRAVVALVQAFGFEPIPAGALKNARYLEPMTEQLIQLGYGLGQGDRIGFGVVRAV
ncbi:NADP oxidoreductase [Sinirhodobacter populi]|uniref:NADP oxidoreductase n=1 Tax=Paenirhodobacter populi TaxID=2306993 RepID=A0A443KGJ4_9RHOB|nr:NAD(P)-binding domain-containing protein [Sinirhodobacter populi]RWR31867.1 NADP oxidoreductase [Sinirhodobacter populi]